MVLRRDVFYACAHRGVYVVSGSSGSAQREENDRIDEWLDTNSLGKVDWGRGREAYLLGGDGVTCTVYSSMKDHPFRLGNGTEFEYKRVLEIRVAPAEASLPVELLDALVDRNFKEIKE